MGGDRIIIVVVFMLVAGCDDHCDRSAECEGLGVLYDSKSCLCWTKYNDEIVYSFVEAVDYCNQLSLDGYEDWRLPTIDEVRTLIRGCDVTETGGDCQIVDGSDDSDLDSSCDGCEMSEGPGANGDYMDPSVESYYFGMVESSSNIPESDYYWSVFFGDASIRAEHISYSNPVCVR